MKKLILLVGIFICIKVNAQVIITQPYIFQKYVSFRDTVNLPNLPIGIALGNIGYTVTGKLIKTGAGVFLPLNFPSNQTLTQNGHIFVIPDSLRLGTTSIYTYFRPSSINVRASGTDQLALGANRMLFFGADTNGKRLDIKIGSSGTTISGKKIVINDTLQVSNVPLVGADVVNLTYFNAHTPTGSTGINGLNGTTNIGLGGTLGGNTTVALGGHTFGFTGGDISINTLTFGTGNGNNVNNVAAGFQAMQNNSGDKSIGIGNQTMQNNTGNSNIGVGYNALQSSSGNDNVGIGSFASDAVTFGAGNIGIGSNALSITTGNYNIAIGYTAVGNTSTTGSDNIGIGYFALADNGSGSQNIAIGTEAGEDHAGVNIVNNSTFLGYRAHQTAILSNSTALGNGATVTQSNEMVYGNGSITLNIFHGDIQATLPVYSAGTNLPVVYNSTNNRFETGTAGGGGTMTSLTPGVGFLSHTPITTSGTINIDTAGTIGSKSFNLRYVPYNNATANVNLGTNFIAAGASLTPLTAIHAISTGSSTPRGILSDQNSADAVGARITMRKSRGTPGTPTVITTGDVLGSWTASGHDGTNYIDAGKVLVTSIGTIGTGLVPSTMALQTMTAAGALTTGILIDQTQSLTFGHYGTGLLHSGSSGAVTSSLLVNADITAGTISNASLANSSITINGNAVSLGTSTTVTASTTNAATFNNGGSGAASGATFDGSTARTISYNTLGAAPLASPIFTGVVTMPTPFTLGAVSVTSTGTQLNYLNAATGTTGTASTNVVFSTSPILVTPTLGAALATSINGNAFTTGTYTLTGGAGKTLTFNNTLTITATDGITMTTPTTSFTAARTDAANIFTGHQTIEGVTTTGATGTGNLAFSASSTFTGTTVIGTAAIGSAGGNNDIQTGGTGALAATSTAAYLFAGASNIQHRVSMYGNGSTVLAASSSYAGTIIASAPISTTTSGTSALLANFVVNPLGSITGGTGSTITDSYNAYIGPAGARTGSATYTNAAGSLWVNGPTRIDLGSDATGDMFYRGAANGGQMLRLGIGSTGQALKVVAGVPSWQAQLQYVHGIFTPTVGQTVNLVNNQYNIINPAGTLATLTVALPSSPANNDVVYIKYTQAVTAVTYSNGTVSDAITTPSTGSLVVLTYDTGTTTWY